MKKVFIGTSWKMNKTQSEALDYCSSLMTSLPKVCHPAIQPFFIPSFVALSKVNDFVKKNNLDWLLGAQNMHYETAGAWTGEISAEMITEAGAQIVELGHSERREFFGESDDAVNKKTHSALAAGIVPLICVGDSADEKNWRVSIESVVRQVKIALYNVTDVQVVNILLAYEPIWAIGSNGTPASPDEAGEVHDAIRKVLEDIYGAQVASKVQLLYGGSVNVENAVSLLSCQNIDGLFIGRSAWEAGSYTEIIRRVSVYLRDQA